MGVAYCIGEGTLYNEARSKPPAGALLAGTGAAGAESARLSPSSVAKGSAAGAAELGESRSNNKSMSLFGAGAGAAGAEEGLGEARVGATCAGRVVLAVLAEDPPPIPPNNEAASFSFSVMALGCSGARTILCGAACAGAACWAAVGGVGAGVLLELGAADDAPGAGGGAHLFGPSPVLSLRPPPSEPVVALPNAPNASLSSVALASDRALLAPEACAICGTESMGLSYAWNRSAWSDAAWPGLAAAALPPPAA
mmetsp:Transcript_9386/g.17600  ORF Transcript_9386/g.17600 Transcript_9386/m.17600 type:complete len:254 (-) Transcript_9386:1571-2332(-)